MCEKLTSTRHAHIYGIDLASPLELVAHNRDQKSIAAHIGADSVVYQSLEDLKSACAALSPRDPAAQEFEVGVFCGKDVTPVEPGYFEHLEKIRGESRKLKVMDKAREAVMNGVAGEKEIEIATKGVKVDKEGRVIPTTGHEAIHVNGIGSKGQSATKRRRDEEEDTTPVRDRMDISLHNFGDYTEEDRG